MAKCGTWHRIQEVRDEDGGVCDGVDEAVMLHREEEYDGLDNVQNQMRMFEQGEVEQQGGGRMRTDICVITNGSGESAILSKVMYLVREDGTKQEIEFEVIRKVAKGTQHNWQQALWLRK